MEWFYFLVIVIALLLLIIMLTYIGTRMVSSKRSGNADSVFPPVKNICPDLWETELTGNITYCTVPPQTSKNVGSMYVTNGNFDTTKTTTANTPGLIVSGNDRKVNFAADGWSTTGLSSDCAKQNWANTRGILWDGISNYNQC